jgi:hypothetical protein
VFSLAAALVQFRVSILCYESRLSYPC